jgi:hypothetical protein
MSRNAADPIAISGPHPPRAGVGEETPVGAAASPQRSRRRRGVALLALLAVAGLILVWGPWRAKADVRDGTALVDQAGMSARHGVDINLIAVTAAGGLIELRMQVTDTDKADAVLHEPADRPVIVVEDTGETLTMATPPHHKGVLRLGGQYFFLLANAHNAIHRGSLVTVVIGDSRLEHLRVEG